MKKTEFDHYQWLNPTSITFQDEKLIMHAPEQSDFFNGNGTVSEEGITPESLANAPFFYNEVRGDFVMRVKVEHDFKYVYDAASIMVMKDLDTWAKFCFELTDFNTHAIVSVVTNQFSDDANGSNIDSDSVWLQISRVGQSFAFHYSLDGKQFFMVRFFTLSVDEQVKVGFVAQSPTGEGGDRIYSQFSLEHKTVKNIRKGV
ncbi:DUF1349 domain-containing protein [Paenibacillus xylanexedens]|uniref:DUF1349 domain-containing protein n=1 Tax=Paenibacillus xylanexedens TaxID=528191 RepID=UPI000F537D6E|nr:DUF1349 domain-containing protein [Paenibacillus xylanexedens]RPK31428.1 hypothetical protein EDO6_02055 [Paenibacillus xylanexedens]